MKISFSHDWPSLNITMNKIDIQWGRYLFSCAHVTIAKSITETEMSSFWWNFHHWLHWKLSKWQLPVQPVMKISSKWRHFRFSDCADIIAALHHNVNKGKWGTMLMCENHLSLRWRHNDHAGVSNHQPHGCLLNRLFRRKSKKTSKLRVTGLCAGNSPGTGEFPAQMASYAENVSIWWRHHVDHHLWTPDVMSEIE